MRPIRLALIAILPLTGCTGCGTDEPRFVVDPPVVKSVDVVPASATIVVGQTIQFVATARDEGNRPVSGQTFTWTTSRPSVLSIDANGRATGMAAGDVTVTASTAGTSGTADVDISDVPPAQGDVMVDPGTVFQTMIGWDVVPNMGHWECANTFHNTALFNRYKDEAFAILDDLGINRVRMPVRAGAENPRDAWTEFRNGQIDFNAYRQVWYSAVNDNTDPNSINPNGFHFSEVDTNIELVINPLRQILAAKGEKLYVVIDLIQFGPARSDPYQHRFFPDEYAEFMLAAFQHIEQRWGWVPDAVEIINEPDNGTRWTGSQIGNAIVATGNRLKAAGYNPAFIAPSGAGMDDSISLFNSLVTVPGVLQYLTEFSYHRYNGVSGANLNTIRQLGQQYNVGTAMLEHIGSGYEDLHDDLTIANNTSWEQFSTAGCGTTDPGGRHILIDVSDLQNPRAVLASRSHFLRLYYKWVRAGAVRVGAGSSRNALEPVAFINKDGRYTVIVKATGATAFTVGGLPAGTYGISYAVGPNDRTPTDTGDLPDVQLGPGQALSTSIPGRGVITIHRR